MDDNIINIKDYVEKMVGGEVMIQPLDDAAKRTLPILITSMYQLLECRLLGTEVCLLCCKNADVTPMQLKKHCNIVQDKLAMHTVVVLTEVKPYNLTRLIQARVNLIVPGRQLFIPSLLMDLRPQRNPVDMKNQPMTVMAQCIVLYHLQKKNLNGLSAQPIAELMGVSYPTINRAIKWLSDNGFVTLNKSREKLLTFIREEGELWHQALPFLQSPIERVLRTDAILHTPICGEEAIAEMTMLAEPNHHCWAVSKQDAQELAPSLSKEFGDNIVEVWKYDPRILAEDGKVDMLSLYLSLRDAEDERVHKEVNQLIKERKW